MTRIPFLAVLALIALSGAALFALEASAKDGISGAGNKAIINMAGCTATPLPANDDGSASAVPIGFSANFFGQTYTAAYVNNNGNITFDAAQATYTPFSLLETARVIIAPFFGDVDTRGGGSGVVTYGTGTYSGHTAFCVNWVDVGYYNSHVDKKNSFQLLLVRREDTGAGDFDMIFNYNKVQWETGDASGGTGGLGGDSARVGYSNGVDTALELPGSAVDGYFLDGAVTGLIHDSRGSLQHGRYIFEVRSGAAPVGGTIGGTVLGEPAILGGGLVPLPNALVQICHVEGGCLSQTTNASGNFLFSGLAPGQYTSTALPPPDRPDLFPDSDLYDLPPGGDIGNAQFELTRPRALPPGVTIDHIAQTATGAPVINWGASTQIYITNDPGCSGTFQLIKGGSIIQSGSLSPVPPEGTYKGTITPLRPTHGPAVLKFTITCPDPADSKTVEADIYIDPSGTVLSSEPGNPPIEGATVTLYRSDSASGPFLAVPDNSAVMSPSNRSNPDMTNADGFFHWDVIAGFYKVRAEKAGCADPNNPGIPYVETGVLTIPPPALDLELMLNCGPPQPTNTPGGPTNTPPSPTNTPASAPTNTPPSVLYGDVNCDGQINAIDAALVLQQSAGLVATLPCQAAGDVNQDGQLNAIDSAIILQYAAGLLDHLPV